MARDCDTFTATGGAGGGPVSGAEVGEDGEDPAVVGVGRREPELAEDVADVLFDGALGNGEAAGDGAVGAAFGTGG